MADLMELLRQKKKDMSRGKRTIKPLPGRNKYRILPTWRTTGDPVFYHDFGQHFIKDTTDVLKAVYMCVDKTFGHSCPVCDQIARGIMASKDDVTTKALKGAEASHRVLLNVLALDSDTPTEPQVLEVSPTVFTGILGLIEEWGVDMIDLDKGTDIIVNREGTGLLTKYTVQVAAKSNPVPASVMKKIENLDEFVAQESAAVAQKALASVSQVAGLLSMPAASSGRTDLPVAPKDDWGAVTEIDVAADEAALNSAGASASATIDASDIDSILADLDPA